MLYMNSLKENVQTSRSFLKDSIKLLRFRYPLRVTVIK